MRQTRVVDMPASAFFHMVGDPDTFVGGGSVAALTGAAAGSTALLVMRLNARRKSLARHRPTVETAIRETEHIVDACADAADADIRILDELLIAHRQARATGDQALYVAALTAAAESTLRIAELVVDLLTRIDEQVDISSRFTVSDLGAAAVLAAGSGQAALLTAEVNVALLLEHDAANRPSALELDARHHDLRQKTIALGQRIERRTRVRLKGSEGMEGST
ncbi:MAG TPA: cyclodeaminase/cyclohydrolase family protein [Thermomicrobiales bacterium]|nr:cyclodeaminase/cyclohydrolase family protein [Thermomicrobiales bacterium]